MNPFNGIERVARDVTARITPAVVRIHSMELKVATNATGLVKEPCKAMNPFNGIESLADLGISHPPQFM